MFPKLRALDIRPVIHEGRASVLLRDPLCLTDRTLVLPQELLPLLSLCDGTRDLSALGAALTLRFGLRLTPDALEGLLKALDGALLLENERSAQAQREALVAFRQTPFRQPVLAGQSYPDDAEALRDLLQRYIEAAGDVGPSPEAARGLVSPHIDYARGGSVYGAVWKRAMRTVQAAELAVILGTNHYGEGGRLTLTRQHYATPFGLLPTAQEVVDELTAAIGEETAFADELHHRGEHSIELAAVWLHFIRQGQPCALLPVLCGSFERFVRSEEEPKDDPLVGVFVDGLRRVIAEHRTVVVAAGDLSHVGPAFGGPPQSLVEHARLGAADEALIGRICAGDAEGFFAAVRREGDRFNVCGLPPIYLALRLLAPVRGEAVAYQRCPADVQATSLVSICGVVLW